MDYEKAKEILKVEVLRNAGFPERSGDGEYMTAGELRDVLEAIRAMDSISLEFLAVGIQAMTSYDPEDITGEIREKFKSQIHYVFDIMKPVIADEIRNYFYCIGELGEV